MSQEPPPKDKKNLKRIIIAVIIAVAAWFGYTVIIEGPDEEPQPISDGIEIPEEPHALTPEGLDQRRMEREQAR